MKINIEIDCTPEEARSFLGLPDFQPMQAAVVAKLQEQMLDAVGNLAPGAMRAWLPWMQIAGAPRETAEDARRANAKPPPGAGTGEQA